MKLITLNIWGGHVHTPLLNFLASHREIDIFCFQEVYHNAPHKISTEDRKVALNIFSEIQAMLPNHKGFFRPVVKNIYGIATFVNKDIDVIEEGEIAIQENPLYVGQGPTHTRILQWVAYHFNNKVYSILNVHGLWNGMGKTDSPERIAQSHRIKEFMETINTPKILCGDFNLRPDTESLKIIENGMNNLIKQHNIASTRTRLYPKDEPFADYVFTSEDININHFETLNDEGSDHSPLLLEFT